MNNNYKDEPNVLDNNFGEPMSVAELAKHLNVPTPEPVKKEPLPTNPEEAEKWEKKQENSNDIYKIKARVKNLTIGNGNLTPTGEILVNTYVHVLKALYDYAESLPEQYKNGLEDLLRSHEGMPGNIISAAASFVRKK